MQGEFSYASQPHAAPIGGKKTPKYRNENDQGANFQNIMFDARVVRGNTYAARVIPGSQKDSTVGSKTRSMGSTSRSKNRGYVGRRIPSPPPVDGRVHMTMQTEDFLEELTDRPIEIDAETQTQAYMDKPASPLFVRAITGADVQTQIIPGDLFDFDIEVEPLLEILVGKTLHISMLELMQEEELEAIRKQQEEFESIRNVELAEVKRLEAEARRKAEERARRVEQEKKRVADRRILEEKIASRSFAQQYLGQLHEQVFDVLEEEGVFYDPVKKEVEEVFMKKLIGGLNQKTGGYDAAEAIAEELLMNALQKAKEFGKEGTRLRKIREAELEEERRKEEEARAKAEAEAAAARAAAEAAGEEE